MIFDTDLKSITENKKKTDAINAIAIPAEILVRRAKIFKEKLLKLTGVHQSRRSLKCCSEPYSSKESCCIQSLLLSIRTLFL